MPHIVLLRGHPGSGKSTIARKVFPNHVLCEADQFMLDENGRYFFDPPNLPKAYKLCLAKARINLIRGLDVVVANTFTKLWELEPYTKLHYPFSVLRVEGNYVSRHNVPRETIDRMKREYEPYPDG